MLSVDHPVPQILSRMCSLPTGHQMVADAISMLRLRFGEPVRFKFLIGQFLLLLLLLLLFFSYSSYFFSRPTPIGGP